MLTDMPPLFQHLFVTTLTFTSKLYHYNIMRPQ
jgi:hypothetical protein